MLARRLTFILFALTFVLLLVGGVVHTTGSSLACPDWPLCYGEVFPPMRGGILFEHSHRLLASSVGLVTLCVLFLVWGRRDARLRILALIGLSLVVLQGCLGGLTVILRLPPVVSIAHLGTSMIFFAWTLVMGLSLRAHGHPRGKTLVPRAGIGLALGLVYLQLVLGALVRHSGASLACGTEIFTCLGAWAPQGLLQNMQTAHRLLAVAVSVAVIGCTLGPLRAARRSGRPWVRPVGIAAHGILLLQLLMGVLTLKTAVQLHVVTTHLGLGAALWALMVAFYLLTGPLGDVPSSEVEDDASPGTVGGVREFGGAG